MNKADVSNRSQGTIHRYIECACGCSEHLLKFMWFDEPNEFEIFLHIFLAEERSFWKRLWKGLKYIFGFKSKYGHFDEIILSYPQVKELKNMCDDWLKYHTKQPSTPEEKIKIAKLMVMYRELALKKAKEQLEKEKESGTK